MVTGEQMAMISADPVVMHSCDRRDACPGRRDLGLHRRAGPRQGGSWYHADADLGGIHLLQHHWRH